MITLNEETYGEGEYAFTDLAPDTYIYNVSREGYFDVNGEVTITDEDVEVTVEMQVDDTSVDYVDALDLQMYPNPAKDQVSLEADRRIDEVLVVDMLGNTVFSARIGEQQYNLAVNGMKPGVYFVQVITGDRTETLRLQVTR